MDYYDPEKSVDPEEWAAIDEGERQYLVELYHREKRIRTPNLSLHATIHVVVENQVAMGSEIPVQSALGRLMGEGLTRHDAIHAIGSVFAGHMFDLMKGNVGGQEVSVDYYQQLEELTAEGWRNSFGDETEEEHE